MMYIVEMYLTILNLVKLCENCSPNINLIKNSENEPIFFNTSIFEARI